MVADANRLCLSLLLWSPKGPWSNRHFSTLFLGAFSGNMPLFFGRMLGRLLLAFPRPHPELLGLQIRRLR